MRNPNNMARNYEFTIENLDEFRQALVRNPKVVLSESKKFLQRAIAKYRSGIMNNPWKIGMSGGGSPVLTGHMRDTHIPVIGDWEAKIGPDTDYAEHVHKKRPWLDHVFKDKEKDVQDLEVKMLEKIVGDLAK